jgi:hypothetical protein
MKNLFVILALAVCPLSVNAAAIAAATVWEVRPTVGTDTNGCAFVAGAAGTDYSQQTSAQFSGTDLATTTTATIVSSASHNFVAADVGNYIYIASGTGFTVAWYQIVSVAANNATVNVAPAAVSTSGATWAEGGSCTTLSAIASAIVSANKIYIKGSSGTLSIATTTTLATACSTTPTVPACKLIGYTTTRGDGGKAIIQASANAMTQVLTISGASWNLYNITVDCNAKTTCTGITWSGSDGEVRHCKFMGWTVKGLNQSGSSNATNILYSEFTGGTGANSIGYASAATNAQKSVFAYNWVHDITATSTAGGIQVGGSTQIDHNIFSAISGASNDCIQITTTARETVTNNSLFGCGRTGIRNTAAAYYGNVFKNNILVNCTGGGILGGNAAGVPADENWDGNAFYNSSPNRSNMDDTTVNAQNNVAPYTNALDIQLTANPYTSSGSNDFTLNTTTGGGASMRGTGFPGAIPGTTPVGHIDFGALQHLDSGSGASTTGTGWVF